MGAGCTRTALPVVRPTAFIKTIHGFYPAGQLCCSKSLPVILCPLDKRFWLTPSNTWKALIRKRGWPTTIKTFRTKRDAQDRARRTEDEMVRGVCIDRADASQLLLKHALDRYLRDVSSTKNQAPMPPSNTRSRHGRPRSIRT